MADHVSSLCRSVYYQLRQLRPFVRSTTEDAATMVVQAFVSSRLDYCNSLLCGIAILLQKLQSVQNAAARLITGTGKREHITPVLRELHWLPVRQRIDFKLAVLVYKALHGQLPRYMAKDCQLLTDIGRRSLRSADVLTCATKKNTNASRRQEFSRRWTVSLELPACRITWQRYLCLQKSLELYNTLVCVGLRHIVTVAFLRRVQIFLLTCLLT